MATRAQAPLLQAAADAAVKAVPAQSASQPAAAGQSGAGGQSTASGQPAPAQPIAGFQDGTAFDDRADRVDLFYNLGLRICQFTYNGRNLLADGCVEPADAGLSRLGRDCIARMNALGILVDLSHVGLTSSWDALEASTQPVAITHSGARAIAGMSSSIRRRCRTACSSRITVTR